MPWGYATPAAMFPVTIAETNAVMAALDAYFLAFQEGRIDDLRSNPRHVWRFYKPERMTMENIRTAIAALDEYWIGQKGWVHHNTNPAADDGPGMSRLPDDALLAMFQELDGVLAQELKDE